MNQAELDILASYYQYIYLLIVTVVSIPIINRYSKLTGTTHSSSKSGIILALFITLFIGLRPISHVFVDMTQYRGVYNRWRGPYEFSLDVENIIYDNLSNYLASISFNPILFYLMIATIYFMCMYYACKKLFPDNTLAAFVVCLAAFSTFSYGTNGIKAGAAASIFLLAVAYSQSLKVCIPLVLVSWGFHHSMQLPIIALILTTFFKKGKYYYYGWIFCLLMAILHISYFQTLFAGLTDEKGASYLETVDLEWGGKSGLRLDFILYSAMPVLVGYYYEVKKKINLSPLYLTLLHTYICINGVWMLCMYANYTNRIAYLSWFLYPVVLVYPYLNEDTGIRRYQNFSKVMMYHLGFTLFMSMIYYGGLMKLLR